jgi:hypothetical protein
MTAAPYQFAKKNIAKILLTVPLECQASHFLCWSSTIEQVKSRFGLVKLLALVLNFKRSLFAESSDPALQAPFTVINKK